MSEMIESVMLEIEEAEKGANGAGPIGIISAPELARASAFSLPVMPLCAGTQCNVTGVCALRELRARMVSRTVCELATVLDSERRAAILSMQNQLLLAGS